VAKLKGWPNQVQEVRHTSAGDDSQQPALFYAPETNAPVPLLVGLHTWSCDYRMADGAPYAEWCVQKGWAFVYPNFRGPNNEPAACGSQLVVQDILGAVDYAKEHAYVDPKRVYLCGASGGGHAALLMAGRAPEVWAAVSAWVGLSDLAAWHRECKASGLPYADDVSRSCGGTPGASAEVDEQYRSRSPLTHLPNARGKVLLDISAGIKDGHTGSVPISHSLRAFNAVAEPQHRIEDGDIDYLTREAGIPLHLVGGEELDDPSYGEHTPLLRRTSGKARLTVFQGGHEIIFDAALPWLAAQRRP